MNKRKEARKRRKLEREERKKAEQQAVETSDNDVEIIDSYVDLTDDKYDDVENTKEDHLLEEARSGIFAKNWQKEIEQEQVVCSSGYWHSLFLDSLGSVWSCGNNQYGDLALGHIKNEITPQKVKNLPRIISVSAGWAFSLFVDENGDAWGCGYNGDGQLGLEDKNHRNLPEKVTNLRNIISVITLGESSIFLDCEGSVWGCGHNGYGELGLGDTKHRNKAEKISGLSKIKSIAGGWNHSLFLDREGSVWACGNNAQGNLGLGDTKHRNKAEKIQGLPAIKSMAGGVHFSMFVDEEGNVWVCGGNQKGQLGMGHIFQINTPQKNNNLSGIVAVAGGNCHYSMFLDNEGNIYTCGSNQHGQLGLGDTVDRLTPQKADNIPPIASLSSCNTADYYLQIVDKEGGVWSCGNNGGGQLGLGHLNKTRSFHKLETIPKLRIAGVPPVPKETNVEKQIEIIDHPHEASEEKEMFKSVEKEQSKQLMEKLKSNQHFTVNKEQAKQKIVEGVIGTADWLSKWKDIHEKKQQLAQTIEQHKVNLNNKQQQLDKLTQEIKEIKQALSSTEEHKEVVDFFDRWLEPIAEAEKELKSGFEAKLQAGKHGEWSVDEVSLFLNVCGMQDLVTHQRKKKIDGEGLEDVIADVTVMEINDRLAELKLKFYLKVLESGKMGNEQELKQSMVWRHREVEKTLLLMKEWDIALDETMVRKKRISICELLFFKAKDFQKELGVEGKEAVGMLRKLQGMKKAFKKNLKGK